MRRIAAVVAGVLVAALVGLGGASARADVPTCADFATQADAQAYYVAVGGPAGNPTGLDPDGDQIACNELPCPCDYAIPAPTPTPELPPPPAPTPAATPRAVVHLSVSARHVTPDQRVWFTIVRLQDDGTGRLTVTPGKVMLQEKQAGRWRTVQASRAYAGRYRTWYKVEPGHLKVRARTVGPESCSVPVRLVSHAA